MNPLNDKINVPFPVKGEQPVQFLVSTMNNKFSYDFSNLDPKDCVVINQVVRDKLEEANIWAEDLRSLGAVVEIMEGSGLSRSRNRAIDLAAASYCVLVDDDCTYENNAAETVERIFYNYSTIDIVSLQAKSTDGNPFRDYHCNIFRHNLYTILNAASIEIAFRRTIFEASKIRFDTRFGLGGNFKSGEENILLSDFKRAGYNVFYIPINIVTHVSDQYSQSYDDDDLVTSKGAIVRRIFGDYAFPLIVLFAVKKYFQGRGKFWRLLSLGARGFIMSR